MVKPSLPRALLLAIAAAVFGLDRWTKSIIENTFSPFDTKMVIPGFFALVRSANPGVAFGIFSESTSKYRTGILIAFSVLAVGILAGMLWRADRLDRMTAAGLALIFGGAAGNVFDRVHSGMVTDFLDFYLGSVHWYTFNLADTAISAGAGLLLLAMWKPKKPHVT